jgi:hypothetical protein
MPVHCGLGTTPPGGAYPVRLTRQTRRRSMKMIASAIRKISVVCTPSPGVDNPAAISPEACARSQKKKERALLPAP